MLTDRRGCSSNTSLPFPSKVPSRIEQFDTGGPEPDPGSSRGSDLDGSLGMVVLGPVTRGRGGRHPPQTRPCRGQCCGRSQGRLLGRRSFLNSESLANASLHGPYLRVPILACREIFRLILALTACQQDLVMLRALEYFSAYSLGKWVWQPPFCLRPPLSCGSSVDGTRRRFVVCFVRS